MPNIYLEHLLCAICFILRASHVVLIKTVLVVRDRNPIYISISINSRQGWRGSLRNNRIQEYKILIRFSSSLLISCLCFVLHSAAVLILLELWLQAALNLNHSSLETKEEISFFNPNFINNNLKIPRRGLINQTPAACPSPHQSLRLGG